MSLTPNLRMTLPPAGQTPWEDDINGNFSILDAQVGAIVSLPSNFQGVWQISTAYTVGQSIAEPLTGVYYTCATNHTSGTGTFAADNGANPTYWTIAGSSNANGESLYFSAEASVVGTLVDFQNVFGDVDYDYRILLEIPSITGATSADINIQMYDDTSLIVTSYSYVMNYYDNGASTRNNATTTNATKIEICPATIANPDYAIFDILLNKPIDATALVATIKGSVIETDNTLHLIEGSGGHRSGADYDGFRLTLPGVTGFDYRMRVVRTPSWAF